MLSCSDYKRHGQIDLRAHRVHVDKYKAYMIALDRSPKAKGPNGYGSWVGEWCERQVGAGPFKH